MNPSEMKRQPVLNNGKSLMTPSNGGDILSATYHTIQPHQFNHTFTYGSSYARARDATLLATSLHWNRDIKSSMINRSPSSGAIYSSQHSYQHQAQQQQQQQQQIQSQSRNIHQHSHQQQPIEIPSPPPLPPPTSISQHQQQQHHQLQQPQQHHQQQFHHSYQTNGETVPGINKTLSPDNPMIRTIGQHYYPEGGWGWIISVCSSLCYFITSALFPAHSFIILDIMKTFRPEEGILAAVLIGAFSTMVTLIFSPVIIALCRRKSIRLTAVVGGLVTALGCLFTSFATQFHQLLISYGIFIGIGVSMLRDTSVIMIGQYFKKRREFVEIFVLTGNGLGIALMPIFLSFCIRSQNWRTGFQSLALVAFINFFIGVLYRPASLYHPQRRAILHLKSLQKKSRNRDATAVHANAINNLANYTNNNDYNKLHLNNTSGQQQKHAQITNGRNNTPTSGHNNQSNSHGYGSNNTTGNVNHKPAYFDFTILKSKTIRILLSGTCISSFGLWTPIFLLAYHGEKTGMAYSALLGLQTFLGLGIVLGTVAFGLIVVKNSVDCMIARQYLCQASSLMISASLLAFSSLDDYSGYLLFVWIYGFFLGGYTYSLKMYVYEKVRARNFNRAWSFVQCVQSIPIMVGVPITAFISEYYGNKSGFFLSSFCTAFGALTLFLIDGTKRTYEDKHKISALSPERTYGFNASSGVALDHYESSPIPYSSPEGRVYIDPLVFTSRPLIPGSIGTEGLAQVNFSALKVLSAAAAAASSSNHHHHHHLVSHPGLLSQVGSSRTTTAIGHCGELYSSVDQHPRGPTTMFNAAATASLTSNLQSSSSVNGSATAAAAAAAAAVAAASAELTCISEEVLMENLIDDYCLNDCSHVNSHPEDKYIILPENGESHHRLNEKSHNALTSFGKHSVNSADPTITGNGHHNRFDMTPMLNGDIDAFENSYNRDGLSSKLQPVQRRASLPIITNTNLGYLNESRDAKSKRNGSTEVDEGLTNKLAAIEGDIEGFIGDLLNRKLSTSTVVTSENGAGGCCSIPRNTGLRWRSASESTGYIGDEGGSDDSNSDHEQLINRCSGCQRFVQRDQATSGVDKNDHPEIPLVLRQQQVHNQSVINEAEIPVEQSSAIKSTPSSPQSTSNLTEVTSPTIESSKVTSTETTVKPETHVISKEQAVNGFDVNDSTRFNDDLVKE